jgi:hypothetical protein
MTETFQPKLYYVGNMTFFEYRDYMVMETHDAENTSHVHVTIIDREQFARIAAVFAGTANEGIVK